MGQIYKLTNNSKSMIILDRTLSERVLKAASDCNDRDNQTPGRLDKSGKYVASFDMYMEDYATLAQFGIRIVDPAEVGYLLGREGDCTEFLLHMLKTSDSIDDLSSRLCESPDIETPTSGNVVFYYSGIPEAPRTFGSIVHCGIHRNGKILSKWGEIGPIFEHGLSSVPYGSLVMKRDNKEYQLNTWAVFKSLQ